MCIYIYRYVTGERERYKTAPTYEAFSNHAAKLADIRHQTLDESATEQHVCLHSPHTGDTPMDQRIHTHTAKQKQINR